jgi:hypothetical protein
VEEKKPVGNEVVPMGIRGKILPSTKAASEARITKATACPRVMGKKKYKGPLK